MLESEVKQMRGASLWQPTVVAADIHHVLISPMEEDGMELADLALRMALPSRTEVTLCCQGTKSSEARGLQMERQLAARLRKSGLVARIRRGGASELQAMVAVDARRHVDLVLLQKRKAAGAAWHAASALDVVRRLLRPAVACGPHVEGQPRRGPIIAAVSMREASDQVVRAAGGMARLMRLPISIVHTVDIGHEISRPDNLISIDYECNLLGSRIAGYDVAVTAQVLCGPAAEMLSRLVARADASLVVAGVDPEEEGSEAQIADALRRELLTRLHCPLLFVPTFHSGRARSPLAWTH